MNAEDMIGRRRTTFLCFVAMAVEGFGLQLAGVAAVGIRADLHLTPGQMALFFTAATLGLAFGAIVVGRLSDTLGRKAVLVGSLTAFGLSSFVAAASVSFAMLLTLRLIGGIALGGGLTNIIAVAAEGSTKGRRHSAVSIAYAGGPAGGALVSLLAAVAQDRGWPLLFCVNGTVALLTALAIHHMLTPTSGGPAITSVDAIEPAEGGLFSGKAQSVRTTALWIAFCGTALMLYLLINWLPILLADSGFSPAQANFAQTIFTSIGILSGLTIGRALERFRPRRVCGLLFGFLALLLLLFATGRQNMRPLFVEVALLGYAINAVQAVSFSIAPTLYSAKMRATGVGAAVAAGRVGGIVGPLLGAVLISAGFGTAGAFLGLFTVAVVSGLCVHFLLAAGPRAGGDAAREDGDPRTVGISSSRQSSLPR